MRVSIVTNKFKILRGNEAGVTLIETVVALAILGIVAVIFLSSMSTAFRGIMVSQERVAAESLASSQLEYIRIQDYIAVADYNPADPANSYQLIAIPQDLADQGYAIGLSAPQTVDVQGGGWGELQSLTVVVSRNGEEMLTISEYRIGG